MPPKKLSDAGGQGDVRKGKRKRDASPSAGIDAQRPSRKPGTDEKALSRVERMASYDDLIERFARFEEPSKFRGTPELLSDLLARENVLFSGRGRDDELVEEKKAIIKDLPGEPVIVSFVTYPDGGLFVERGNHWLTAALSLPEADWPIISPRLYHALSVAEARKRVLLSHRGDSRPLRHYEKMRILIRLWKVFLDEGESAKKAANSVYKDAIKTPFEEGTAKTTLKDRARAVKRALELCGDEKEGLSLPRVIFLERLVEIAAAQPEAPLVFTIQNMLEQDMLTSTKPVRTKAENFLAKRPPGVSKITNLQLKTQLAMWRNAEELSARGALSPHLPACCANQVRQVVVEMADGESFILKLNDEQCKALAAAIENFGDALRHGGPEVAADARKAQSSAFEALLKLMSGRQESAAKKMCSALESARDALRNILNAATESGSAVKHATAAAANAREAAQFALDAAAEFAKAEQALAELPRPVATGGAVREAELAVAKARTSAEKAASCAVECAADAAQAAAAAARLGAGSVESLPTLREVANAATDAKRVCTLACRFLTDAIAKKRLAESEAKEATKAAKRTRDIADGTTPTAAAMTVEASPARATAPPADIGDATADAIGMGAAGPRPFDLRKEILDGLASALPFDGGEYPCSAPANLGPVGPVDCRICSEEIHHEWPMNEGYFSPECCHMKSFFHRTCLATWVVEKKRNTCPMCRGTLYLADIFTQPARLAVAEREREVEEFKSITMKLWEAGMGILDAGALKGPPELRGPLVSALAEFRKSSIGQVLSDKYDSIGDEVVNMILYGPVEGHTQGGGHKVEGGEGSMPLEEEKLLADWSSLQDDIDATDAAAAPP